MELLVVRLPGELLPRGAVSWLDDDDLFGVIAQNTRGKKTGEASAQHYSFLHSSLPAGVAGLVDAGEVADDMA
ncbi:hypothetical protein ACFV1U_05805 [Streptomyces microflavus]|uniref:hypothetical protein n=1 Tax=Streptomyces microflavus TaxID=1919 RepID=UPI0036AF8683